MSEVRLSHASITVVRAGRAQLVDRVVAPGDAQRADAGRARHLHVERRVADHDRTFGRYPRLRHGGMQHGGMRFRRMIVGGLHREEPVRPALALEQPVDALARLAGGDAEHDVVARAEGFDGAGDAFEQRLVQFRIAAYLEEGRLVALHHLCAQLLSCSAARTANASGNDSPTMASVASRVGALRPKPVKACVIASQMPFWLSTSVPSQSRTTSFIVSASS